MRASFIYLVKFALSITNHLLIVLYPIHGPYWKSIDTRFRLRYAAFNEFQMGWGSHTALTRAMLALALKEVRS